MLDIGGGSATYSIAFAKKNKNLTVTLIDLPPVLKITREMITENRLTKRFHLIGGDFFKVDFGSGYDLVYISHIIHQNGGNENLMLAKKAYQSLHEGGEIVLHDFFLDDSGTAPLFSATFALNMLVHTETGRSYKFSEVEDWLTEAGFTGIRKAFLEAPSSLLVATKCNAIR
jgi:ubiquinone/menaquinone biosynthesis C-methylase UbiE